MSAISRILLTDIMFPNKYAKWRLNEIYEFINRYDTDILVINRISSYCGIKFEVDYEILKESFKLDQYDILIFNPSYNWMNIYNTDGFDGTTYNSKINATYLLRKKKYRDVEFSVESYSFVYHIFLMCHKQFNTIFTYPLRKQIVHMYPGGGFSPDKNCYPINPRSYYVTTQRFVTEFAREKIQKDHYIEVIGGPFILKDQKLNIREINNGILRICLTSLGSVSNKGGDVYMKIAEQYTKLYPNDSVEFIGIGNIPNTPSIRHIAPMSQDVLDKFYFENVDIIFNLETGGNGFPLGVEAIIQGCVPLTTDTYGMNVKNGINLPEFCIIDRADLSKILDKIKQIYTDRQLLNELSRTCQGIVFRDFSYENQTGRIFSYLDELVSRVQVSSDRDIKVPMPKIAVITPTYNRKNASSKAILEKMFAMLKRQTYQDFKLYLIGDDYDNREEFTSICESWTGDIYYENLPHSFRSGYFKIKMNLWAYGGALALFRGMEQAVADGADYYLHLDDDETWTPDHIETMVEHICKYPDADFILTGSKYGSNSVLPREFVSITKAEYNNWDIQYANAVHSTWCINLRTLGKHTLDLTADKLRMIEDIKNGVIKESAMLAYDGQCLSMYRQLQDKGVIKSLLIPKITCCKISDGNVPVV